MKKGISNILVAIIAFIIGGVIGFAIFNIAIGDNKRDIDETSISNEDKNVEYIADKEYVQIGNLEIVNKKEASKDECAVYPSVGKTHFPNSTLEDFGIEVINDTTIKYIVNKLNYSTMEKEEQSIEIELDGKIVESMSCALWQGSIASYFILTENGSVYYLDNNSEILKIEELSEVTDLIQVTYCVVRTNEYFNILSEQHNNTVLAVNEDNKAYDIANLLENY